MMTAARRTAEGTIDAACPGCGLRPGRIVLTTITGIYCQCQRCSTLWRCDEILVQRGPGNPEHPRRRKGDRE